TRYSQLGFQLDGSPDLSTLADHPEQLFPLWHQLPDFLIDAGGLPESAGVSTAALAEGAGRADSQALRIRLLTNRDLSSSGAWAVNAVPDSFGVEHFSN